MLLALALVVAFSAGDPPIAGDATYPVLPSSVVSRNVSVCVGSSLGAKPVVALIFRRDGNSYVRVGIVRGRPVAKTQQCSQQEIQIALPPLSPDAAYVVGVYSSPPVPPLSETIGQTTTGITQQLDPIAYFGIAQER